MGGTIATLHGGLEPLDSQRNSYLTNTKGSSHILHNLLINTANLEEELSLAAPDAFILFYLRGNKEKEAFVLRQLQLFTQLGTHIYFKSKL